MTASTYRYKGYDYHGKRVDGEVVARSPEEAERKIAAQDITIVSVSATGKQESEKSAGSSGSGRRKRLSDGDTAVILRNLTVMVETGVPLVEAIEGVAASVPEPGAGYLRTFKEDIVGGKSVSRAMRSVPRLFPSIVSDMVRVAEDGGHLDQALGSAASYLERSSELRKRILGAMMYPMVMLFVAFATVIVLVGFVIPRFSLIFTRMKAQLPITTKMLLACGDLARNQPIPCALGAIGLIAAVILAWKTPRSRECILGLLRRTPGVGDLIIKLALSRAFMSVSTLLKANVSIIDALEHGARVAWDPRISAALLQVRQSVEHGGLMAEAMAQTGAFPPIILQMVGVGERTGRLAALLGTCAESLERDADSRLKSLVALVEPLMIVAMGAVVGTITISIIGPIYSVVENIK